VSASVSAQVASAVRIICPEKTRRPPYFSVQTPRNSRVIDPVRIGVATSRPNWVSFRPNSALMATPMMEKIVQTAKQAVKAIVLRLNARV
jgi:hypothetical protein